MTFVRKFRIIPDKVSTTGSATRLPMNRSSMDVPNHHRVLKDRRTKNLTRRLQPGDIALIHHTDLDTTAARALVDLKVAAVINAARSIS